MLYKADIRAAMSRSEIRNRVTGALTADGSPNDLGHIVVGEFHRAVAQNDVHAGGMIASCGHVTAVESCASNAVTKFSVGCKRVGIIGRDDDASIVLFATIRPCWSGPIIAGRDRD